MSYDSAPNSALALRNAFQQAFDGMQLLAEANLTQPFLGILYSTIDAAAWLAAEHDGRITKKDFISWASRYLLPGSGLECSAIDLYAARCGILHSFSAYSHLHSQGKARLVCYALGTATVAELKLRLRHVNPDTMVAVHAHDLANAVFKGWERYLQSVESDPAAVSRLANRASFLFSTVGDPGARRTRPPVRANG